MWTIPMGAWQRRDQEMVSFQIYFKVEPKRLADGLDIGAGAGERKKGVSVGSSGKQVLRSQACERCKRG